MQPDMLINPLNNYFFTAISSILIISVGWWITDKIVEPRLAKTVVDGDQDELPQMEKLEKKEIRAFWVATIVMLVGIVALIAWTIPSGSPMRSPDGEVTAFDAPIMMSIVPLIFLLFVIPGVIYGFLSGTFKSSQDAIGSMSKAMSSMSYYIVMAFFCALFIDAFGNSNIGILIALKGANFLQSLAMPGALTIVGIILLTAVVNLLVGSASAKWALISPIFVPMLMGIGISPDLTQAAYRVGDSVSNIITPLLPYFPLVVVFCQRYVKNTGIGTLVSMMLPYFFIFLVTWTIFLLLYWFIGIPLGLQASYTFP
ncbi:MAG: AbgT family transporter, partial [Balneolaceae bacterium]